MHSYRGDAMAITIATALPPKDKAAIIAQIATTVAQTPSLTPRSAKTLTRLSNKHYLSVLLDDGRPVGWVVREPLTKSVHELGMAYIEPAYRDQHFFGRLIDALLDDKHTFIFATYSPAIIAYASKVLGFKKSTLSKLIVISHGRFLIKRLSPQIMKLITKRVSKQVVHYAIRKGVRP